MPPKSRRKALIYCRISQDREGAGLGVDRQRDDCEKLAAKLGWTVVATYSDNDVSAYSGKRRPGYRSLLADLEVNRADAVIVWHTDRLHRSPKELEEYVDICERHKVTTQTVKAGEIDLATPSGRAVARTLGAWARFEVEHKSERTRRAQSQAAAAGKWLGGAPPIGWTFRDGKPPLLDQPAARRIRRATADVLSGASLGSVVRSWNDCGFVTSTGRRWTYTSVRQVLTRARNAGLAEYQGEIVGTSPWPAIVTEDQWLALCALFADPARRRSQTNRAKHLMAGIAVCGKPGCGLPLRSATVVSGQGSRFVYRCPATGETGHVARSALAIDELVDGVMAERFGRADVADLLVGTHNREDLDELRSERVALRARLTEVADEFADDESISPATLRRITDRIKARLSEVDAALNDASRGSLLSGIVDAADPRKAWFAAPIDRKRSIIRDLVSIVILPSGKRGRFFDPDLVQIDWRQP